MPPTPYLHKPNATIIFKKCNFQKIIPKFDQYSRLFISLNVYQFSAKILKTNLKFEQKLFISL